MAESATRWRPPASPGRLSRPRLLAVLQRRFETPMITVAAGAGFGKTSLLVQALAENRLVSRGQDVWLSCQPGDAAASRLASGLFAALQLDATAPEGPEEAAAAVATELWRRSPTQVALVLDDVHAVPRNSPGARLLDHLLVGLPANAHLVLAGRPPLPVPTARLAASAQLIELGEAELLFDDAELHTFAAERAVPLPVVADSGGWPALAELAAAAGRARVVDYLWEELLDRLAPQQQRLLAALVAVGGGDAQLMAQLAGQPVHLLAGQPVHLDELLRGLPLVLGEPGGWRALHPLWEPALAGRLGAEETAAVRREAAVVLVRRGAVDEAFRLFCAARAWAEARSLIRQVCAPYHPVVASDVLAEWHELLPAEQRREPAGRLLLGLVRKGHDVGSAEVLLHEAAAAFRAAGQGEEETICLVHLLHIAAWRMDRDALATLTARGEEVAAAGKTSPRGVPMLGRALLAHVDGRAPDTLEHLNRIDVDGHPGLPVAVEYLRALELLRLGLPRQAVGPARRSRALGKGPFHSAGLGVEMVARWLDGEVDDALALMAELIDAIEANGRAHNQVFDSAVVALLVVSGDLDHARQQLRRAQQATPYVTGLPPATTALITAETALLVAQGDEDIAAQLLGRHPMTLPHTIPYSPLFRSFLLVLSYVLVPGSRHGSDTADLDPFLLIARTVAQAVVAARDGCTLPDLSGVPPSLIRAHLPLPWAAELAAALLSARRADGTRLLSVLGTRVRPALRALARGSTRLTVAARRALTELPPQPEEPLDVRVLGPLTLYRGGRPVTHPDLRRERVRLLLLYLIAHPTSMRSHVAGELWPDLPDDAADRNLRVTLTYLQRVLEPDRSEYDPPFFLRSEGPWLHLAVGDQLTVDATSFDHEVRQGAHADRRGIPSQALAAYQRAVGLYRGDYLADAGAAEWALVERDRLRLAYTTTAVRAGELLIGHGDSEQALRLGHRALHADRWSEAAYRLLAAAYVATGDRDAARRVLRHCRRMLRDLGVEPGPETLQLERRLTHPSNRRTP